MTDYKQLHAECADELLNAIIAYDAAYKRADELTFMLEKILRFQSKTPEDRDDLLTEATKLLKAHATMPNSEVSHTAGQKPETEGMK